MAQISSTQLAAAADNFSPSVRLSSISGIVAGMLLAIDAECMLVLETPVTTTVSVMRGYNATVARAHASGQLTWFGVPDSFAVDEPTGVAVAANEAYTPRIVPRTGSVFVVANGRWVRVVDRGFPVALPGNSTQTYTASGAIQLVAGTHLLNAGSALAMTLAAPDGNTPEGAILQIISQTAQAHTVTYTAGFRGGTTSDDVATFGAAIGNYMLIVNVGGAWRVVASLNVTLG